MSSADLIDVCIPVHDPNETHLNDLLASLEAQAFPVRVHISDDSSAPRLDAVVKPYRTRLNIRLERAPFGGGMVRNWNAAVRMGRAPYVMLVGQDDVLASNAVRHLYEALSEDEASVICGGGRAFIDGHGRPIHPRLRSNDRSRLFMTPGLHRMEASELARLSLRNGNVLGEPSSVLFRRRAFDAIGGYDDAFRHAADVDFNLRMASCGPALYTTEIVLLRRRHRNSETAANIYNGASSRERLMLWTRYEELATFNREGRDAGRAALALHAGFDLVRGMRLRSSSAVKVNARALRDMRKPTVRSVFAELTELTTGRNRDAR
jgi:GT2 family glycosyltransferase